uniref:Uncharacterized protein LOC111102433 isoform X2 n=1 Tax=Crassostrea virginica TaxID=6565 RepID=A0A8B8AHW6_CRAVI|nr:uncharacterized protein LOC111102433 isoform X2 [Crassostrea virginica]
MNSRRRTRKRIIEESLLLNCEQRKEEKEKESFEAKFINELIGQGVFTKKDFIEGEVLLEYSGELIEGDVDVDDTYVFQIRYKGKQYCIDATKERSLGRLLNDDHRNPNCKPKIIEKDGKPHVYFVALRDINTGEELRYNYGPGIYSWRTSKKQQRQKISTCVEKDSKQLALAKITVIKKDDSLGAIYPMDEDECVIGSGRECNIKLSLKNVDKIHAVVAVERSKAYLTNYSKNFPVILNEKPIEIGKELNNGDVLAIGGRKFLFNREEKFDSDSDLSAETSEHPDPVDCHSDLFAKTSEHPDPVDCHSDLFAETSEHPDPVDCHLDLFAKTSEHPDPDGCHSDLFAKTSEHPDPVDCHSDLFEDTSEHPDRVDCHSDLFEDSSEHSDPLDCHSDLFEDSSEHSDPLDPEYEMSEDNDSVMSEEEEEFEHVSDSNSDSDVIPYQGQLPFLDQEETVSSTSELQTLNSASNHKMKRATNSLIENEIITSTVKDVDVQQSGNQNGIRVWDKVHYCVYCEKGFTNITKHYLRVHSDEKDVQLIKSHPLKSTDRKLALLKLRNCGDYQHNHEVLRSRHGTLVTFTRNWNDSSADQFLPCQYCLGFFLKSSLWRHTKNCPFAPEGKEKYRKVSSQSMLLLPASTEVSEGLREKVLSRMSSDEISIAARNDPIIVRVGEKLHQKHGHLNHLYTYVSQKMRELGRLLISLRETDKDINSLDDAIHPMKFPAVVRCTKFLCGFKENSNSYSNPSLALKLGHSLKKCAKIKKSIALIQGNEDSTKNADAFFTLCENEWTDSVSSSALQTLASNKVNKGHGLPLTDDIQKLQAHLKEKTEKLIVQLQETVRKSVWDELNQVTLARLVMFNRRRGGEAERMTLKSFCEKRSKSDSLKEIEDSLKPLERILCKTFSRVEIRGKRGRTVPILITPALERSIVLLNETREQAGVNKSNPYVFARSSFNSLNPVRSSDCLRKFAEESGVKNTQNLTSTKLRKHVATVSQILNLEKNDIEIMAGFLGHDIRVHRSFYRLPSDTLQIARMGTILTAFDNGEISKYSGMSLDEIACEDIKLGSEEGNNEVVDNSGEESDEDNSDRGRKRKWKPPKETVESGSDSSGEVEANESAHDMFEEEKEHRKDTNTGSLSEGAPGKYGQNMKGKPKRVSTTRHQWTEDEKAALRKEFKQTISLGKTPGHLECLNAIRKEACLAKFSWKQVKFAVKNLITSERRQVRKMAEQV